MASNKSPNVVLDRRPAAALNINRLEIMPVTQSFPAFQVDRKA